MTIECETWADHVWQVVDAFVEIGRHPTMGQYQTRRVVCVRCGRESRETLWLDLPAAPLPVDERDWRLS